MPHGKEKAMEPKLILGEEVTLEEMYALHDEKKLDFVIRGGKVTEVIVTD